MLLMKPFTQKKKENMNLNDLLNATATPFTNEVLKNALEANKKAKQERLGTECVRVLEQVDITINSLVGQLRKIRKEEKRLKDVIEQVNIAVEFFKATGNPFPYMKLSGQHKIRAFCDSLGIDTPAEEDCKVPENFVIVRAASKPE